MASRKFLLCFFYGSGMGRMVLGWWESTRFRWGKAGMTMGRRWVRAGMMRPLGGFGSFWHGAGMAVISPVSNFWKSYTFRRMILGWQPRAQKLSSHRNTIIPQNRSKWKPPSELSKLFLSWKKRHHPSPQKPIIPQIGMILVLWGWFWKIIPIIPHQ